MERGLDPSDGRVYVSTCRGATVECGRVGASFPGVRRCADLGVSSVLPWVGEVYVGRVPGGGCSGQGEALGVDSRSCGWCRGDAGE